jgi:hypothetical protein
MCKISYNTVKAKQNIDEVFHNIHRDISFHIKSNVIILNFTES